MQKEDDHSCQSRQVFSWSCKHELVASTNVIIQANCQRATISTKTDENKRCGGKATQTIDSMDQTQQTRQIKASANIFSSIFRVIIIIFFLSVHHHDDDVGGQIFVWCHFMYLAWRGARRAIDLPAEAGAAWVVEEQDELSTSNPSSDKVSISRLGLLHRPPK